jgi:signal transduction histidine kinase
MLTFRDFSIKNKLKIVIIFTSAIILLLVAVAFVISDVRTSRRNMVTDLFTLANLVGINSTAGLLFDNNETTEQNLATLKTNPHIIFTRVFSKDGNPFAHYFRDGSKDDLAALTLSEFDFFKSDQGYFFEKNYVDIFKNIIYKGRMIGTVYIRSDLGVFDARLQWVGGIVFLVLLISLLLAFILASKLQKFITQPIENLLDTMKNVSKDKDYSIRTKKSNYDEFGKLIDAFNDMLMQIETRDKQLNDSNDKLEEILAFSAKLKNEVVQSEKMAALGQLVAGIAHEINTPLGAISSSADSIAIFLDRCVRDLPKFVQSLDAAHQQIFWDLLFVTQQERQITSKEKRKYRRALVRELEGQDISDADTMADTLVDIGIYGNIEAFLPLLKAAEGDKILNMVYQLSTLKKSTQTITTASERAAKTVFALKSYARYDETGEKTRANILDGIETVLTLYHNQLKHGIEVIKNYAQLPSVFCYPDELNQVWTNLVHNALQAMNYRGTLRIDAYQEHNNIVISVTDSGVGIPDEIKPKIFEPFFTTKPAGEGSGLGLDIVKKIIDKHKGKITVQSKPGKTIFTVYIPIELNNNEESSFV